MRLGLGLGLTRQSGGITDPSVFDGGTMRLYSGSTAADAGDALASAAIPSPSFGFPSANGIRNKSGVWQLAASLNGQIRGFYLESSDTLSSAFLTVTESGGGGDVIIDHADLQINDVVTVSTLAWDTTGGASSLTAISRDSGSAAGGTVVVLTGTGFNGIPNVLFGAAPATGVVVNSSTSITCTVPAHAAGAVNVSIGSHVLTNGFTYWAAPTTTYASQTFEGGVITPFATDLTVNDTAALSTTLAVSPTHSVKITCGNPGDGSGGIGTIQFICPNNAALIAHNPNGVFFRFFAAADSTLLTNLNSGGNGFDGGTKQIKIGLQRYDNSGSGQPGWLLLVIGPAGGGSTNEIVALADDGVIAITGGRTGVIMAANTFVEVQVCLIRIPGSNTGRAILWLDGVKKVDVTHVDDGSYDFGKNADTGTDQLFLRAGATYHNVTGALYVDNMAVADGYIN